MSLEKLRKASEILLSFLSSEYQYVEFRDKKYELKIILNSGIKLFIRYNTFGKYGYSIVISPNIYDRIRFDNLDDLWSVETKPHHKHPRGTLNAEESPMKGNPEIDMPIFVQEIKKIQTNFE